MEKIKIIFLGLVLAVIVMAACRNKTSQNSAPVTDTSISSNAASAPVLISPDDSLKRGVQDAVKDYPGVNGSVNNGEITLTGDIKRDQLTGLMQSLHSLHPKKINNNLTIK